MKDINDILNESLLDDEDEIFDKGLPFSIMVQYNNMKKKRIVTDHDMFDNELKVGDLILGVYQGRPSIGIIRYIRTGMSVCAVQYTKEGNEVKRTPSGDYLTKTKTFEIVKISPEAGMGLIK
jgi:hypothetical protein